MEGLGISGDEGVIHAQPPQTQMDAPPAPVPAPLDSTTTTTASRPPLYPLVDSAISTTSVSALAHRASTKLSVSMLTPARTVGSDSDDRSSVVSVDLPRFDVNATEGGDIGVSTVDDVVNDVGGAPDGEDKAGEVEGVVDGLGGSSGMVDGMVVDGVVDGMVSRPQEIPIVVTSEEEMRGPGKTRIDSVDYHIGALVDGVVADGQGYEVEDRVQEGPGDTVDAIDMNGG
ncbi:hypothetical protein HK102_013173, partial [Quaeritorhiza haematococci]